MEAKTTEEKRAYHRARTYGVHDIDALLDYYGYFCPLCSRPVTEADAVDHDHKTGKVRGVLCQTCNITLGVLERGMPVLKQSEYWLTRANHYLTYNYGTNPKRNGRYFSA
jgi:hypothetical protein